MANEEHLKILKQGIDAWNQLREKNPDISPDLRGMDLSEADLRGADLIGAKLSGAKLRGADLSRAKLSGADLRGANLSEADFIGAKLSGAKLSGADLHEANLRGADLHGANLHGANLSEANLIEANLIGAKLIGANLIGANLQGAIFYSAIVDGGTLICNCEVDENTDFSLVGLGDMRIDSGTRQLLEYNIRRRRWLEWCFPIPRWKTVVKCITLLGPVTWLFWWMSDYGKSTLRVIGSFFALAAIFAVLYWQFPGWLVVDARPEGLTDFLHAFYFSIVTMTTLGFGDIHASPTNQAGQIALIVQVLLGYVMLGVLVTRIAVLFTSGGPAGKFVKMDKKKKAKLDEIKNDKAERASKTPEQE